MTLRFVVMLLAGPLLTALIAGVPFAAAVGRNGTVGIRRAGSSLAAPRVDLGVLLLGAITWIVVASA